MAVESVNYDCPVRGYHVYESVWEPKGRQYDMIANIIQYNTTIC